MMEHLKEEPQPEIFRGRFPYVLLAALISGLPNACGSGIDEKPILQKRAEPGFFLEALDFREWVVFSRRPP